MNTRPQKYRTPPPFSSENARNAQRLAVAQRRATDEALRRELAERIPAMPRKLRQEIATLLRIRQVEALLVALRSKE